MDSNEVKNQMDIYQPDVVLMDIDMPGINGIDGTIIIKQFFPDVQVLMLTVFEEEDKIFDAICAGANGYLLKRTPPEKIISAIYRFQVRFLGKESLPKFLDAKLNEPTRKEIVNQVLKKEKIEVPESSQPIYQQCLKNKRKDKER